MTDIDWRARAEAAEQNVGRWMMIAESAREAHRDAETELAAAREDSARLDWMRENRGDLHCERDGCFVVWPADSGNGTGWHADPRAAIDEARSAGK